jgi:spore germination cell wall hydrolase CwlJ-like protein
VLVLALLISGLTSGQGTSPSITAEAAKLAVGQPPKPEPLVFAPLPADEARLINDAVPFADDRGPAAKPFRFAGDTESRGRAIDCLATAMWYEAGESDSGQRAVGQVILNRVRHPAFPGTVCGVVFQGSERATGCQFTFTCDGAMHRLPSQASLESARARSRAMLDGAVSKEVGLATHYHTNWVHPLWSADLDKIAQVDTHLFFRWQGGWGGPSAQRQRYQGGEPVTAQLAMLSPFHRASGQSAPDMRLPAGHARSLAGPAVDLGGGKFQVSMSAGRSGNVQAMAALDLCGDRDFCRVTGLLNADERGPWPAAFLYVRDRQAGVEKALWDCTAFKRPTSAQCFSASNRSWVNYSAQKAASRKPDNQARRLSAPATERGPSHCEGGETAC